MGTATPTAADNRKPQRIGTRLQWEGTLAPSSSYATGGETITASSLGMSAITGGIVGTTGGHLYEIVPQTTPTTAKLLARDAADGTQIASTTDLSADAPFAMILGR